MNEDRLLKKRLGIWSLSAASLGGVIGSGWLFGAMYAAKAAGPESIVAWIVGAIAFGLVALVFSELAIVKPESGGLVRYPMYTNGSLVASLVGWGIWLGYAGNPPTEASGIVQYVSTFIPGVYNGSTLTPTGILLAVVLMIVFVLVNYFGVHIFAKVNLVVTIIKFVVPTLTLIAFFMSGFHPQNFTSYGGFAPYGWSAGLSSIATAGIVFAYTGFRAAVDLSGEAVNPRKDIPRAVLLAIFVAMILYIGLQVVFIGTVPTSSLATGWHGVNFNSPFAQIAMSLNLMWLYWMLMADSMISPAGSSLVYTASNSRVVFGLAKNRFFPRYFAKINEKYGTPTRALILNFIVGLLYLFPLKSWHNIISTTGALGIFTYSAGAVSVLVFRRMGITQADQRMKAMNLVAPLGFVVGSLIIYWASWGTLQTTISLLFIGLVLYAISFFINKQGKRELIGGTWLIIYLIAIFTLSKLGSFGGLNVIPAPLDSVVVAMVSLLCYYWAVSSGTKFMNTKETGISDTQEFISEV
ncbi:APC family permease [Ferroacidibacillus organovorans]|uniref:Amino acid permease n=1 Tax=Ferroacidibacillus organovorans TaxID=1765683 RepID=A0A162U0X0_9BACL|nr:APC family permease [Ferroacidibacillus organovorans]KYP81313.1 amino acid permease [Ferroacidibacillus organovorans]OAG95290.1 amino acid permease [Ferroacidibacillus organovorans]OPG17166.1 amino acid permease [Ferroacidibacillus organovorans]